MAVKHRVKDGSYMWTLPGGRKREQEKNFYETAMEALASETGIRKEVLSGMIMSAPDARCGETTRYFVHEVSQRPSDAAMMELFGKRADKVRVAITHWKWFPLSEITEQAWRKEDQGMLRKLSLERRGGDVLEHDSSRAALCEASGQQGQASKPKAEAVATG